MSKEAEKRNAVAIEFLQEAIQRLKRDKVFLVSARSFDRLQIDNHHLHTIVIGYTLE